MHDKETTRDQLRANTVTFGFSARHLSHASLARTGAFFGAIAGFVLAGLAAIYLGPEWIAGQSWMGANLDALAPIVAPYSQDASNFISAAQYYVPFAALFLLFVGGGALIPGLIIYGLCTWFVHRNASNIHRADDFIMRLVVSLPSKVSHALARLDHDRAPFILCRRACHTMPAKAWALWQQKRVPDQVFREPRRAANWGPFNQLNFAIAIATARALHAKIWEYDGDKFYEDVTTNRTQQKTVASSDHDQHDLELRFVQDEPQRPFEGGDLAKPAYTIFQCLLNPIQDPVWVLPLSKVMERMEELCARPEMNLSFAAVVETLKSASFPIFRRVERDATVGVRVKGNEDLLSPILKVIPGPDSTVRYLSGYDENNIAYAALPPAPPVRRALYAFQMAMDEAARKDAICVDLNGGDMLLVRSQEAFYCRREMEDSWYSSVTTLPRIRWLRRYMAFEDRHGHH